MVVKNEAETAVAEELERLKGFSCSGSHTCWCPLCEADVAALTLSCLRPSYCTFENYCLTGRAPGSKRVQDAVRCAARRVSLHPKHRPSRPGTFSSSVRIVNFTYREAVYLTGLLLLGSSRVCRCRQCFADILAYALNHYPARYGVEHRGRTNLSPHQREFIRHELIPVIARAAAVVTARPHH